MNNINQLNSYLLTSDFDAVNNLRGFVAGDLTRVLLLILRGGGPDHQVVPVHGGLEPHLLVHDLVTHGDDALPPLPEHHEPLESVDKTGQPARIGRSWICFSNDPGHFL